MQLLKMLSFLGIVIMILGVAMFLPVFFGLYYGEESGFVFFSGSIFTFLVGLICFIKAPYGLRSFRLGGNFEWL